MNKFNLKKKRAMLKQKLLSAIVLLLVSSIMMVSTTYAWFVMSTAPEVSGIETQVGANGALEIALLSKDSWNDLDLLDAGDFDESLSGSSIGSINATWGNLVSLSDNDTYGLNKIVLMPSRLNIKESGTDSDGNTQYSIGNVLLKTPVYAADGRIEGLEETAISSIYNKNNKNFTVSNTQDYGVRAIGISSDLNENQLALNSAKNSIISYTSASRTKASKVLNEEGPSLANIVINHALNSASESYDDDDIDSLIALASGLKESLGYIDLAIRQVFAGYIASDEEHNPCLGDDSAYETALVEINDTGVSLSTLLSKYPDLSSIETYINKFNNDLTSVNNAISTCEQLKAEKDSFTWSEISSVMSPLCNYNYLTLNGKLVDEYKDMTQADAISQIASGSITIAVPTGSGILSDIADFAGDYTAKVVIASVSYGGMTLNNITTTMETQTTVNPYYLSNCSTILKGYEAGESTSESSITDYYGYAIDLAFRTNAEESNLMLQTESKNRVYDGDDNESLQGGGSYMTFSTTAGVSSTKIVKLMNAIRVVFIDEDNDVLAVGKLDTTLGKDVYEIMSDEMKIETGKYAFLSSGSGIAAQLSDYIDNTTYNSLIEESKVEFDGEGNIKAKLYLYEFSMPNSEVNIDQKTGALKIGEMKDEQSIVALEEDVPKKITVLVYLDGSIVTNALVAANSTYSMTGTLNLQFSSDATLIPAEVNQLRTYGDE